MNSPSEARETCRIIFSNTREVSPRRPCSIRSGDLETLTSRCANKPSRNVVRPERGEKKSAGGKREEKDERARKGRKGMCTRARTRLSGQFESIKPKVVAGLCSSTRSLLPETPFCSLPSTGPAILGGSRGNKPAIFTLHRHPRHSWPKRSFPLLLPAFTIQTIPALTRAMIARSRNYCLFSAPLRLTKLPRLFAISSTRCHA